MVDFFEAVFFIFLMVNSFGVEACSGDICLRNSILKNGECIQSSNGNYKLCMQHDGNLVIYCVDNGANKAVWETSTNGKTIKDGLYFQEDGNLVLYNSCDKRPLWASRTDDSDSQKLIMQGDGNLVLYNNNGGVWWSSKTKGKSRGGNICLQNSILKNGELIHSGNGKYDGNLVIYCFDNGANKAAWETSTNGKRIKDGFFFQEDGNLVIYNSCDERPLWASQTDDSGSQKLIIHGDGNLVLYDNNRGDYWSSQTTGKC